MSQPLKGLHSIKLPPQSTGGTSGSARHPIPTTSRGRANSPAPSTQPIASTPLRSNARRGSLAFGSPLSFIKSKPESPEECADYKLSPEEIIKVARLIEESSYSAGVKSPRDSIKDLIRKVKFGEEHENDNMLFTPYRRSPPFCPAGYGTVLTDEEDEDDVNSNASSTKGSGNGSQMNSPGRKRQGDQNVEKAQENQDLSLELLGYKIPDYIVEMENILKAKQELREKAMEERKLRYIAEREKLLPSSLVNSVNADLERMANALDKFFVGPAFEAIQKEIENPTPKIPCPIGERKEMIKVLEALEKINTAKLSFEKGFTEAEVDKYVDRLVSNADAEANAVQRSITELKKSTKATNELQSSLDEINKFRTGKQSDQL